MGAKQMEITGGKWTVARLRPKMRKFAEEYRITLNATKAYKSAYQKSGKVMSDAVAAVQGHKLLKNPKVQAYIEEMLVENTKRTEITADRVLQEIGRIAFSDIRMAFDAAGKLKAIGDWDDEFAPAVSGVKESGSFETGIVKEIRLWSKDSALEKLCRHLGIAKENVNLNIYTGLADAIREGRERAAQR